MAEPWTCPYCGETCDPFYMLGDPHPQLDELLDESGTTEVECEGCERRLVIVSKAVWSFEVDEQETADINDAEVPRG